MQVFVCLADIFVKNRILFAKFVADCLGECLADFYVLDILDSNVYGGAGVMGGPFPMFVGVVAASNHGAVVVIFEHLVVNGGYDIDGGIQLGPQTVDVHGFCFQYREAKNLFMVVLLFSVALDNGPWLAWNRFWGGVLFAFVFGIAQKVINKADNSVKDSLSSAMFVDCCR